MIIIIVDNSNDKRFHWSRQYNILIVKKLDTKKRGGFPRFKPTYSHF
ncbi:MAG: hypothetical protein K0S51_2492 [Bacillales bacterium]|jgi:hypothetical protein|nr:hypothetical protein [Bacillales bacterium]